MSKGHRRCNNCGYWVAGMWGKDFPKGCALGEEADHGFPCKPTRIDHLEMALRRALMPDAFDERGRIKPGRTFDVLEAESAAIRSVAALRGPIPANLNRVPHE